MQYWSQGIKRQRDGQLDQWELSVRYYLTYIYVICMPGSSLGPDRIRNCSEKNFHSGKS